MKALAKEEVLERLVFDERGLIPVVVQEARTREVLMMAYMNREALRLTLESGETWFFSRSRQTLWHKGETSGHRQRVVALWADCDYDTLLVEVEQVGGIACHEGEPSCFHHAVGPAEGEERAGPEILRRLYELVLERQAHPRPDSYTCRLLEAGPDRILQKVGEEAVEVVIAGKNGRPEEIIPEVADLLYHLLVFLGSQKLEPERVFGELQRRRILPK
ncbi:MAG: bifunctional phosphoribosyl-AMP cyclohydrolase/phosphoribosyl-ATP diphosphatase HisIE [Bacillota bacterium]|nr:bifunctional phosphoribosyl-AMP cyclohydrolase/phosphoribosyl-ATP diphosphatase HisIE [Bacillota bacterium]